MAGWVLNCRSCLTDFQPSEKLLDFLDPRKPIIPLPEEEIECPNCGHKAKYLTTDLLYR